MKTRIHRRDFLKNTVAAGAVVGFPTIISSSALGKDGAVAPSERVNIGLIGCGDRSGAANSYKAYEKSEVVAVCDPVMERRRKRSKDFGNCADYNDFRDVLALDDVDAVHVVTPDHWHVPISLAAARAGKDMYTEKPLGMSVEQDLAAREIVDKHNRIFQYGTQNRSMVQVRLATELVLNGHIGDVEEIYVWAPIGQSGGSATPVLPVPEGFDYDLWLGPAPEAPYCRDRCQTSKGVPKGIWHIYDYAIGFIAGWGAHPLDQLQWWADQMEIGIPVEYKGTGKIPTEGLCDTITHWDVKCTYANGLKMRFMDSETVRKAGGIPNIEEVPFNHGTMYIGSKGWVVASRGSWKVFPETLYEKAKDAGERKLIVSTNHQHHFVDCVLDRTQPISDLSSAVQSDLISHFGDISIRTGRKITWDPVNETIVGDADAKKMMRRPMRGPWTL